MPPALLDAIQQRFSCREFVSGRLVTADELTLLLEAGRLAPSAFGLEPWRFVAVADATQRAAVARACHNQPAAMTAAAFIGIVALVAALDPDSDYVRARFETEARGEDTAPIYAAHLGLGTCPIGGFDAEALAAALALPPGETPALLIALGHCRHAAPERLRKRLD
jgi:nitroreductase